jgi:hypothetical protein
MLQFGAIVDDRFYPLQQLVSCSFEEWSADLNMEVLAQSEELGSVA